MKKCLAALLALLLLTAPAFAFGPAGETMHGIDVSVYQENVDFSRVAQSGVRMVYIRSTLGFSYVDPTHERNADGAKAAGLEFGFYHFCTASTTDEAVRQARFSPRPSPITTMRSSRCWSFRPRANSAAPRRRMWRWLS